MRRVLNLSVALITFLVGIASVALWLNNQPEQLYVDALPSPSLSAISAASQNNPEMETYAVYSALIKEMYVHDGIKLLVIETANECPKSSEDNKASDENAEQMRRELEKDLPGLERTTVEDFLAQSNKCEPLSRRFDVPVNYVLMPNKEIDRVFRKDGVGGGWKRFYDEYQDSSGIISFSNVGFNAEMNQAFIYTGKSCGGLCGAGYEVLLTKQDGVWKVLSKTMTWVS
jgi:hypothetical protein